MIGYAFDGHWAKRNRSIIDHFLAATHEAKELLASSETEWQRLASTLRINDANALANYRRGEKLQRLVPTLFFAAAWRLVSGIGYLSGVIQNMRRKVLDPDSVKSGPLNDTL